MLVTHDNRSSILPIGSFILYGRWSTEDWQQVIPIRSSSNLLKNGCLKVIYKVKVKIKLNLVSKIPNCFLKILKCFIKMLKCLLISVDSASKKAYCFIKMLKCFLISVDSASKKAYYFLKVLKCFLISVHRAFILAYR